MKYIYSFIGFTSTILGIIGIFLPLMPTTCFLITAVWAFSKSNHHYSQKILNHKKFGPPIQNWMEHKTISRKLKLRISSSILFGFSITFMLTMPSLKVSLLLLSIMFILLYYINTRSEKYYKQDTIEVDSTKLNKQNLPINNYQFSIEN